MPKKKTGGRVAGTPNKTTAVSKAVIAQMLNNYFEADKDGVSLMTQDFLSLEPKDRMMVAEKMMQYTLPKLQAVAVDVGEETRVSIDKKLLDLAKVPGVDD